MKSNLLIVLGIMLCSCRSSVPMGAQISKPVKAGFLKGPGLIGYGTFYFLDDKAVYKPSKLYFFLNFQKESVFQYSEIDTVENAKLYGIIPIVAKLKMKSGKTYKIRVKPKKNFDKTLNDLKN